MCNYPNSPLFSHECNILTDPSNLLPTGNPTPKEQKRSKFHTIMLQRLLMSTFSQNKTPPSTLPLPRLLYLVVHPRLRPVNDVLDSRRVFYEDDRRQDPHRYRRVREDEYPDQRRRHRPQYLTRNHQPRQRDGYQERRNPHSRQRRLYEQKYRGRRRQPLATLQLQEDRVIVPDYRRDPPTVIASTGS